MQSRRNFLMLSTGFGALALAGCANSPTGIPTWVSDIQAIGSEVGQVLALLPTSVPAATVTQIQTIISAIESAASAIGASSTQTQGQSVLIQIEGYINSLAPIVLPLLSAIPGIGPAIGIIGIIVGALPEIEAAVNIVTSLLSSQAQALVTAAPQPASAALRSTRKRRAKFYIRLLRARR